MVEPRTATEPSPVDALTVQALDLSRQELLELMGRLLQAHHQRSTDRGEDEAFLRAWGDELQRRSAEIRSGREPGVPAEEVLAQLREELEDDDRGRPLPPGRDS